MEKLSYNKKFIRIFYFIQALILFSVTLFIVSKFGLNVKIEIYLFMITGLILTFIIFYFNCLDVDIFLSDKKALIVKAFYVEKEFINKGFEIKSIFVFTMFFSIYLLQFHTGESYRFKHLPIKYSLFYSYKYVDNARKIEFQFKNQISELN